MNNVLIIGNGFDRQLGLKTDYISFLDWVENKGIYFEEKILNFIIRWNTQFNTNNSFINKLNLIQKILKRNINDSENYSYNRINPTQQDLIILNLLKSNNENILNDFEKKSNLWFSYFNYLRKENSEVGFSFKHKVGEKGEWIDLESLIEENIKWKLKHITFNNNEPLSIYTFSKLMYIIPLSDEDLEKKLWNDFIQLKTLLSEFIQEINEMCYDKFDKLKKFPANFPKEFNKIISFNYSYSHQSYSFRHPELSKYFTTDKYYYVHGTSIDNEKIVFGFDSFFPAEKIISEGKSKLELDLLNHKELSKYTKIQQLLTLQAEKEKFEIGVVDKLSILGHSIGEQDYNYFFSIMDNNIEKIEIEYLWYKYNDNKEFNNRQSGQDALFNMINAYEKYANKRVFHKMIFEGRIKFKEVNIPKIV